MKSKELLDILIMQFPQQINAVRGMVQLLIDRG